MQDGNADSQASTSTTSEGAERDIDMLSSRSAPETSYTALLASSSKQHSQQHSPSRAPAPASSIPGEQTSFIVVAVDPSGFVQFGSAALLH